MLLLFWTSQGLNPPLCGNFAAEFTTRELGLLGSGAEMSYLISTCTGGRMQMNRRSWGGLKLGCSELPVVERTSLIIKAAGVNVHLPLPSLPPARQKPPFISIHVLFTYGYRVELQASSMLEQMHTEFSSLLRNKYQQDVREVRLIMRSH